MNFVNVLSNGMFERAWNDFDGAFYDFFVRLIYIFITGMLQIIYTIESVFYYLAGLGGLKHLSSTGLTNVFPSLDLNTLDWDSLNTTIITEKTFGIFGTSEILNVASFMAVVGVCMVVIFLLYSLVKALCDQEGKTDALVKTSLFNTFKASIFIFILPIAIPIIIGTINTFLALIFNGISLILSNGSEDEGNVSSSIAYQIYRSLFTVDYDKAISSVITHNKEWVFTGWNVAGLGKDFGNYWKTPTVLMEQYEYESLLAQNAIIHAERCGSKWSVTYCLAKGWGYGVAYADAFYIKFFDVEALNKIFDMSLSGQFGYLVGFVAICFTFVSIGLLTLRVCERLFELLIDYILVIPACSTMVLDGGQRYKTWKELFTGRLLNFSGSVICMLLYTYVLTWFNDILNKIEPDSQGWIFFKSIVFLLVAIGGGFTCVKAGNMISQLIGQTAAHAEGQSLQQSMQLAQMGARVAGAAGGALAGVGLVGAKKLGNGIKNQTSSAGSGKSGKASLGAASGGFGSTGGSSGGNSGGDSSGNGIPSGGDSKTNGDLNKGGGYTFNLDKNLGGGSSNGSSSSGGSNNSSRNVSTMSTGNKGTNTSSSDGGSDGGNSTNGENKASLGSRFLGTMSKAANGVVNGITNWGNTVKAGLPHGPGIAKNLVGGAVAVLGATAVSLVSGGLKLGVGAAKLGGKGISKLGKYTHSKLMNFSGYRKMANGIKGGVGKVKSGVTGGINKFKNMMDTHKTSRANMNNKLTQNDKERSKAMKSVKQNMKNGTLSKEEGKAQMKQIKQTSKDAVKDIRQERKDFNRGKNNTEEKSSAEKMMENSKNMDVNRYTLGLGTSGGQGSASLPPSGGSANFSNGKAKKTTTGGKARKPKDDKGRFTSPKTNTNKAGGTTVNSEGGKK